MTLARFAWAGNAAWALGLGWWVTLLGSWVNLLGSCVLSGDICVFAGWIFASVFRLHTVGKNFDLTLQD